MTASAMSHRWCEVSPQIDRAKAACKQEEQQHFRDLQHERETWALSCKQSAMGRVPETEGDAGAGTDVTKERAR